MSNTPTVMLNGDQIYIDELIRENARLTIQHEADKQNRQNTFIHIIKNYVSVQI